MDKYKLISKKGQGTFSDVLKAQCITSKQFVAIKCMKQHFENIAKVNGLNEILALKKLSPHPNIVNLLEILYDEPTGRLALVFELMDENLYEYMVRKRREMNETKIRNIIYQLTKSINHMHKNGVFHRDLKPENILITDDIVKLADFGSCRGKKSQQPFTEYISTRWYRAPECLLTDGYYDEKMDIWGIGCVFYEILTGQPLFPGRNELDQIDKIHEIVGTPSKELIQKYQKMATHMEFKFEPNQKGNGLQNLNSFSPECVDILEKMLKYDPEERISAKQCLKHPFFRSLRDHLSQGSKQNIKTNSTIFSLRNNQHSTHFHTEASDREANYQNGNNLNHSMNGNIINSDHGNKQYRYYNNHYNNQQYQQNNITSNNNNNNNNNNNSFSVQNTIQNTTINMNINTKNNSQQHSTAQTILHSLNVTQLPLDQIKKNLVQYNQQNNTSNKQNVIKNIVKHHSHHNAPQNHSMHVYLNMQTSSNNNSTYQQEKQSHQEPMFPDVSQRHSESNRQNYKYLNISNHNNNTKNIKFPTSMSNNIEEEEGDENNGVDSAIQQHTDQNLPYLKKNNVHLNINSNQNALASIDGNVYKNGNNSNTNSNNSMQFKILPQTIKRGRIPTIMPSDANYYNRQSPEIKALLQSQQNQHTHMDQIQKQLKKLSKSKPKSKYISPYSQKVSTKN